MATVSDNIQYALVQKIVPTILESLWGLDPVYPMFRRSSTGVKRNGDIGRGWQVKKTWSTGMAGGAKFQSAQGSNVLSGPVQATMYDTPNTFQGVDETTAPALLQTTLTLIQHAGNFFLPHQIMRADRLSASIGSIVALNLKGLAELLAQQEAAVWYSNDTTTYALANLGDVSACCTVSGATMVIDIDDLTDGTNSAYGRVHRFRPGMLVDVYDKTGATKRNAGFYLLVDNVDALAGTVTLRRVDGQDLGWTVDTDIVNDDVVVIKDSVSTAPNSLESWIADGVTNTSWFGLTVNTTTNSQYRSYLVDHGTATTPTEATWNKYHGRFFEAYPGKELSDALTTTGVLLAFIANLDGYVNLVDANSGVSGRIRYDRQGQAMKADMGWESFDYRFGSKRCKIWTSTYMAPGTWIAGKLGQGGITRYVPPRLPGSNVDSRFGEEVEFIAGLGGSGGYQGGIFKHAHSSSGQTTDFVEAPFVRHWNCMPQQAQFLKVYDIEDTLNYDVT
jgi:hypothetical protein